MEGEDLGIPLSRPKSETRAELGADFSRRLREHDVVEKEHFMNNWAIGVQTKSQQEQNLLQKMPNYGGAETVGLAASIVGLVVLAREVSKLLYGYHGDALEDINQLASKISLLAGLLEPLSTVAEASRVLQTPDPEWMPQFVHEFWEILAHLKGQLPHQISEHSDSPTQRVMRSLKTRLLWPFTKEEIQNQIQKIERLKATIILRLQL